MLVMLIEDTLLKKVISVGSHILYTYCNSKPQCCIKFEFKTV